MKYRYLWAWLLEFYEQQYWAGSGRLGGVVKLTIPRAVIKATCSLLDCTKAGGTWEDG